MENLLTGTVQAGARGALSQGSGVLLFFPLTHNLLAAEPLAHGLLVACSDPLIHLEAKGLVVRTSPTGGGGELHKWRRKHLVPLVLRHPKLIMAQQERPHLFTQ